MKREVIYVLVLLITLCLGYFSKTLFIESQWQETKKNYREINKIKSEFLRDSLIQIGIDNIKLAYETNKRGKSEEVQINSEIIATFEDMFNEANIKIAKDNISSGLESKAGNISYFNLSLNFKSEYKQFIAFLNLFYSNDSFMSLERLSLRRYIGEDSSEEQEMVEVDMDINVIKMM